METAGGASSPSHMMKPLVGLAIDFCDINTPFSPLISGQGETAPAATSRIGKKTIETSLKFFKFTPHKNPKMNL
jgi:hypothetical protein